MERRLQKDFQIGTVSVEGIVNAVIQGEKQPKDVFSQIARAIGRKTSQGSKRKDWNEVVRQNTIPRDPIGSSTAEFDKAFRRSLRRRQQLDQDSDLASLDPTRLIEYNPNLQSVTPTTRVAYAKFMLKGKPKPESESEAGELMFFHFISIKYFRSAKFFSR